MPPSRTHHHDPAMQRGAALMVMLIVLIIGAAMMFVASLNSSSLQIEHDKKTAAALAQAKDGLIGYAVNFNLNTGRPGDLPCPDITNTGVAGVSCGSAAGSNQALRLGHLPWKTLGLPDLRDGSGERLWYAVSNNFKKNIRTALLNSDTPGTITSRNTDGSVMNDGNTTNGAVAVIIAPGEVLKRSDQAAAQDRSSAGMNNPINYLDIATVGGITEDNANFIDGSSTDGFIQGRIKDSSGNVILNDHLLVITQDNIMQPIQKRVAAEVKLCLNEYAAVPQNNGRYPWTTDPTNALSYSDTSLTYFGRVPDALFASTRTYSGNNMTDVWGANCNIQYGSWWLNWKEMVFYGIANAYKPFNPPSTPTTCPACLMVNPPSATADKQFVVIVAGKILAAQIRTSNADKSTLSNYLEAPNSGGATTFAQGASSTTFNDTVVFP